jgi:RNA recognition motif-containing protein
MKLFVGNLPYTMNDAELNNLMSPFGTVVSAKVITDHFSGQTKGFGFVEMSSRPEGHKAMEGLNGTEINHRKLICNEAKPQKKKGARRR